MPIEYGKTVTEPQARVLFAVWEAQRFARAAEIRFDGLSNLQIQKALGALFEHQDGGRKGGTSLANVKKIIEQLVGRAPEPLLIGDRSGNDAVLFKLPPYMVRWQPTAAMLLHLQGKANDGPVTRQSLVQDVAALRMKSDDGSDFLEERIVEAIEFCRTRKTPYIEEDVAGFISTTGRVEVEYRILRKMQLWSQNRTETSKAPPSRATMKEISARKTAGQ